MAEELRPVSGDAPEWPGGRPTRFLPASTPIPADESVVALVPLLSRPVGPRELDLLPALRIVANYAVGYENIDLGAAAERGVAVSNTPGVLTEATADLTWALLLAAGRRLREGLELAVSGEWKGWRPAQLRGRGLRGRTLGILGAGRIGAAVARRASPFGLEVLYWSRSGNAALERDVGARRAASLEEALEGSDLLSLHLPLTPETEGLIGAAELTRMREGSILVNTGRGGLVRVDALVEALRSGPLAAAGLDVYPQEPEIPAALRELPNAFLLPHLGSATHEARRGMWEVAAENVRRVLRGEAPSTPVGEGGGRPAG